MRDPIPTIGTIPDGAQAGQSPGHLTPWQSVLLVAILAAFLGRMVATYRVFNDTFDEHFHIAAGLQVLEQHRYTLEVQHPPLARVMLAALPYYFAGLRLGHHHSLWFHGDWYNNGPDFFWKTLSLARAGNLIFAAALYAAVFMWSRRLYGGNAGLAACLIVTCCPTLLGHGAIATLDMATAATVVTACYLLWRWSEQPGLGRSGAAALACGIAAISKFSAIFFLAPIAPIFFIAARWKRWKQPGGFSRTVLKKSALSAALFLLVIFVVIWAGYFFEVGMMLPPGHQYLGPYSSQAGFSVPRLIVTLLGRRRLPAYQFVDGIVSVLSHNHEGHMSYLLGHRTDHGVWYYFLVALAVKATLPLLVLVLLSTAFYVTGRYTGSARGTLYPLLAVAVIMGVSMAANLNIGIRHILPVFPLFAVLASGLWAQKESLPGRGRHLTVAAMTLLTWHVAESALAHPDYLAYFNEIARGREERFLLDSNLDWGQDLARLGHFQQANHIALVHLRYFGASVPGKMGVREDYLRSDRRMEGWVAVSLCNLMGLYNGPEEFAWLRERYEPIAHVGKSIWVYYLSSEAKPAAPAASPAVSGTAPSKKP